MLKIFNECLNAINKCIKGLLEDGLLSVNQEFGIALKPWQRKALDGIIDGGSVVSITGCHIPAVNVQGMPTDSIVVGIQYEKDNQQCWCSALVVCNSNTEWANASLLQSHSGKFGADEDNVVINFAYPHIGLMGQQSVEALPAAA